MLILFIISFIFERGRECFATNPYWNYGFIDLPCYFIDTTFKTLLNPSYSLFLLIMPEYFPVLSFFMIALITNSILIYLLIKLISKKISLKINNKPFKV